MSVSLQLLIKTLRKMYTFTLDDRLVDKISPLFKDAASMQRWLQRELELIVIYHAGNIPTEELNEQHSRLARRVASLGKLEQGWDGQAALTPSSNALSLVSDVINYLPEDILSFCAVFPSNDSSVYLQGRFPNGRLAAHFDGAVMNYVLKFQNGHTENREVVVGVEAVQLLADTTCICESNDYSFNYQSLTDKQNFNR